VVTKEQSLLTDHGFLFNCNKVENGVELSIIMTKQTRNIKSKKR